MKPIIGQIVPLQLHRDSKSVGETWVAKADLDGKRTEFQLYSHYNRFARTNSHQRCRIVNIIQDYSRTRVVGVIIAGHEARHVDRNVGKTIRAVLHKIRNGNSGKKKGNQKKGMSRPSPKKRSLNSHEARGGKGGRTGKDWVRIL